MLKIPGRLKCSRILFEALLCLDVTIRTAGPFCRASPGVGRLWRFKMFWGLS